MEFFDDLSVPVKFLIAFVVALAMLGVGGYLMRRFSGPRGRQPRLAVIKAAGGWCWSGATMWNICC